MRKNTARRCLHAALDLLPVLLIPVFMIYSHRHTLTERTEVDIKYKYQSNEVNISSDVVDGNIYLLPRLEITYLNDYYFSFDVLSVENISNLNLYNYDLDDAATEYETYLSIILDATFLYVNIANQTYVSFVSPEEQFDIIFENVVIYSPNYNGLIDYLENEFTFNFEYTDYNVIESVDVKDTNSSIMNVFMDDFNYSIDKYFNMGNVFNMRSVYNWFNTNIFGGQAPTVIYSVYCIVIYEFVMDLLFLLYALFMWFIDMCKALIEKPLNSIK